MTITIDSLTYVYQRRTPYQVRALDDLSLQIIPGELVGVAGPSGAGKSCLLRCLAGVLTPTCGQIRRSGRLTFGLVMQEPERQFFLDTVLAEVGLALTNHQGDVGPEFRRQITQVLERVGYQGELTASPFRLSRGQQRRVALASILVMNPDVLLLDEPTAGMDARGLAALRTVLAEYRQKRGTVIVVSHDLDFLFGQVDRLLVLSRGRLQADLAMQDLLNYPRLLAENAVAVPEVIQLQRRRIPEAIRTYLESFPKRDGGNV
jgi:energy-coupling factor transporter ATP-binding protein EcfA2